MEISNLNEGFQITTTVTITLGNKIITETLTATKIIQEMNEIGYLVFHTQMTETKPITGTLMTTENQQMQAFIKQITILIHLKERNTTLIKEATSKITVNTIKTKINLTGITDVLIITI